MKTLKSLLLKSLNQNKTHSQILSAVLQKAIVDTCLEQKKIDITPYLISTKYKGNTVFVKTRSGLVSYELQLIQEDLLKSCNNTIKKLGYSPFLEKIFIK